MSTQSWATAKQMSLACIFLVTVWFAFGEHLPSLSECIFRRYPAEDAIAACLNLQPTTLLPLVQGDGDATTTSQ